MTSRPSLRPRCRQHVNPLGIGFETFRGSVPELPDGTTVELEIGCADAQFLFERAERDANAIYLGVEIREPLVVQVNEIAELTGLPVYGVFCNANNHLEQILPRERIDRVYLNFPDPWFKKKHHKRRMIDASLLEQIHRITRPGAEVFFQSDVWDLAIETLDLFERAEHLYENQAGEWSFWKAGNPYGVRSWREANAEVEGLDVWRLLYHRR